MLMEIDHRDLWLKLTRLDVTAETAQALFMKQNQTVCKQKERISNFINTKQRRIVAFTQRPRFFYPVSVSLRCL